MKKMSRKYDWRVRIAGIVALLLIAVTLCSIIGPAVADAIYKGTEAYQENQDRILEEMTTNSDPCVDITVESTLSNEDQAAILEYMPQSYLLVDVSGSNTGTYYQEGTARYEHTEVFTDFIGQTGADSAIGTNIKRVLEAGARDIGVVTDAKSEPVMELDALKECHFQNVRITVFYTDRTTQEDLDKLAYTLAEVMAPESCTLTTVAPNGDKSVIHDGYQDPAELLANLKVEQNVQQKSVAKNIATKGVNEEGWFWRKLETIRPYEPMVVLLCLLLVPSLLLGWWIYKIAILPDIDCECPADQCCCCVISGGVATKSGHAGDDSVVIRGGVATKSSHAGDDSVVIHGGVATKSSPATRVDAVCLSLDHLHEDRVAHKPEFMKLFGKSRNCYTFGKTIHRLHTAAEISAEPCEERANLVEMLKHAHQEGHKRLVIMLRNLQIDEGALDGMAFEAITLYVPVDAEFCPEEAVKLNKLLPEDACCHVVYMAPAYMPE